MRRRIALLSALLISTAFSLGAAHAEEKTTAIADSEVFRLPALQESVTAAAHEESPVTDVQFSCSPVAQDREICLSSGTPTQTARSSPSLLSADRELTCSHEPDVYRYTRLEACLGNHPITVTESKDGKPVGTATFQVTTKMSLEPRSLTWKESVEVKYAKHEGKLTTTTFGISFDAECDRSCSMAAESPWEGHKSIAPGQTLSGDVTYTVGTPNSGFNGGITTKYEMDFTQAGTIPIKTGTGWTNGWKIRCDNEVGKYPGCVYAGVTPEFEVSESEYAQAAATYRFQQEYSNYKWGTPSEPLRRLANEGAQQKNRDRTCVTAAEWNEDTPELFVYNHSTMPDDSCDEYPFAASQAGGAPGYLCNDVEFELVDGTWIARNANPSKPWTKEAPCTRGHVPELLNERVGGELGRLTQDVRILDWDPYTVTITE